MSLSQVAEGGWDSSKGPKRVEGEGVVIRVEERASTRALLPSYVRTSAPEFDLIFPRKEIRRKWPTEGARLFFRKPLKIYSKLLPVRNIVALSPFKKISPSHVACSQATLKRILNDSRLINCAGRPLGQSNSFLFW